MSIDTSLSVSKTVASVRDSSEPNSKKTEDANRQKAVDSKAQAEAEVSSREDVDNVVQSLNSMAQNLHRELLFSVDEDSGETIIKVVDKETDEVVREIPSEEVRQMRARLKEAAGIIFHDSA